MQYFEKLFNYNVFFGYYQQNMSWAVKNYKTVDTLTFSHTTTFLAAIVAMEALKILFVLFDVN